MSCLQCLFFLRAASERVFPATRNSRCHFSSFIQWRYSRYGIRQTWGNRKFVKLCNQSLGALVVCLFPDVGEFRTSLLVHAAQVVLFLLLLLLHSPHPRGPGERRMCKQRQVYSRRRRGRGARFAIALLSLFLEEGGSRRRRRLWKTHTPTHVSSFSKCETAGLGSIFYRCLYCRGDRVTKLPGLLLPALSSITQHLRLLLRSACILVLEEEEEEECASIPGRVSAPPLPKKQSLPSPVQSAVVSSPPSSPPGPVFMGERSTVLRRKRSILERSASLLQSPRIRERVRKSLKENDGKELEKATWLHYRTVCSIG